MSPVSFDEPFPLEQFRGVLDRTIRRKKAVFDRKIERLLASSESDLPLMLVGIRNFESTDPYPMDDREEFVGVVGELVAGLVWIEKGEPKVDFFVMEMLKLRIIELLEGGLSR